jgi:hypothetical protein
LESKRNHVYQSAKIQIFFEWAIIFSQIANFAKWAVRAHFVTRIGEERDGGIEQVGGQLAQQGFEGVEVCGSDDVRALPRSSKELGVEVAEREDA